MPTEDAYTAQLSQLLPTGRAVPSGQDSLFRRLIRAMAVSLVRVHLRALDLLAESDPRTTVELLESWERVTGLPDPCTGPAETIQERRTRVVQQITRPGLQNVAFYQGLAESLGYDVVIEEFIPGEHEFFWRVTIPEPRLTLARAGVSRCGDRLTKIDRADDLECLLQRLKPAHTELEVAYTGT